MTIVAADATGLGAAEKCLSRGEPIIIPTPSPLAYVFFADVPAAVNEAKGRPADQPTGIVPASLAVIRPFLDVDDDVAEMIGWLIFSGHVSVLAPAVPKMPGWLAPAVVKGMAALGGAWLSQLDPLFQDRAFAYSSSANRTGTLPATTAAEADAAFGGHLTVIDGDRYRRPEIAHGSTTMVSVAPNGALALRRHGINDAEFGDDDRFIADLRARYASRQLAWLPAACGFGRGVADDAGCRGVAEAPW
jgi:tRNA A37 threonylcarbamoyladenosine synthetase subunit TsaC/SUA5/YrdC